VGDRPLLFQEQTLVNKVMKIKSLGLFLNSKNLCSLTWARRINIVFQERLVPQSQHKQLQFLSSDSEKTLMGGRRRGF